MEGFSNGSEGSSNTTSNNESGDNVASKDQKQLNPSDLLAQMARLQAQVFELQAENEQLARQREQGVTLKVTDKGGLSVYGLQRFPVTLYKSQWLKLFSIKEQIESFIVSNDDKLAEKPPKVGRPSAEDLQRRGNQS
jgi:hypothetical protein